MGKKTKKNLTREIAEELDVYDDMLDILVDLLEEKGTITREEWENAYRKESTKSQFENLARYSIR